MQCFGEKEHDEEFSEADVLSAVRFDESGDYLATGDKGGRIVIFKRAEAGRRGRWHPAHSDPEDGEAGGSALSSSSSAASTDSSGHAVASAADAASASSSAASGAGSLVAAGAAASEYRFYTEFQSHEAEFDYLKSMEIEEKINQIAW